MLLRISAFLDPVGMDINLAFEKFYNFMTKCKESYALFSGMHFSASSLEKAMKLPLPDTAKSDFISALNKEISITKMPNEVLSDFRIWKDIEGCDGYMSIEFVHCTVSTCAIAITFVKVDRSGVEKSKNLFNTICAEIINNFPVLYITENFLTDAMAWHDLCLNIGWAIYAPTKDIGRIKNFPAYEIVPGFTRIACVEDVFDVNNPNHVEKTRELEKEIASNSQFVKRVGFKSQYTQ